MIGHYLYKVLRDSNRIPNYTLLASPAPFNIYTNKNYTGRNSFSLSCVYRNRRNISSNFEIPGFGTFNQIKKSKLRLKKGTKSCCKINYFRYRKESEIKDSEDNKNYDDLILSWANVFYVHDCFENNKLENFIQKYNHMRIKESYKNQENSLFNLSKNKLLEMKLSEKLNDSDLESIPDYLIQDVWPLKSYKSVDNWLEENNIFKLYNEDNIYFYFNKEEKTLEVPEEYKYKCMSEYYHKLFESIFKFYFDYDLIQIEMAIIIIFDTLEIDYTRSVFIDEIEDINPEIITELMKSLTSQLKDEGIKIWR